MPPVISDPSFRPNAAVALLSNADARRASAIAVPVGLGGPLIGRWSFFTSTSARICPVPPLFKFELQCLRFRECQSMPRWIRSH